MNMKNVALAVTAVGAFSFTVVDIYAKRHMREATKDMAVLKRSEDSADIFQKAEEGMKTYENMLKREEWTIKNRVRQAKYDISYDEQVNILHGTADKQLIDFKNSINYNAKKTAAEVNAKNALTAYKKSINYDAKMIELKKKIAKATEDFEKRVKLCDAMGGDISDTTATIKVEAEKVKTGIIEEANKAIAELNDKVAAKESGLLLDKQDILESLERQVENEKTRIDQYVAEEMKKLDSQMASIQDDIVHQVRAERTPEELEAINNYSHNKEFIDEQMIIDQNVANDIFTHTTKAEMISRYLTDKKVPTWVVGAACGIMVFSGAYLLGHFATFCLDILKRMHSAK